MQRRYTFSRLLSHEGIYFHFDVVGTSNGNSSGVSEVPVRQNDNHHSEWM